MIGRLDGQWLSQQLQTAQAQSSYFNQLTDLYKNTAMLPYRDTYNSDGPVLWKGAEASAAPVAPKTIRQELQSDVDLWLKGIE